MLVSELEKKAERSTSSTIELIKIQRGNSFNFRSG